MDAIINLKMTPAEFDLMREALETAQEHESDERVTIDNAHEAGKLTLFDAGELKKKSRARQLQLQQLRTKLQ